MSITTSTRTQPFTFVTELESDQSNQSCVTVVLEAPYTFVNDLDQEVITSQLPGISVKALLEGCRGHRQSSNIALGPNVMKVYFDFDINEAREQTQRDAHNRRETIQQGIALGKAKPSALDTEQYGPSRLEIVSEMEHNALAAVRTRLAYGIDQQINPEG